MPERLKKRFQLLLTWDKHYLKWCWIILDGLFLPVSIACLFAGHAVNLPHLLSDAVSLLVFIPVMGGIFLRCFYLPQILTVVFAIASILSFIQDIRRGKFQMKELIRFLVLAAICIWNLYNLEEAFIAAMSV